MLGQVSKPVSDGRSYLWLAVGLVLTIFSNGLFMIIPLAAWLAPALVMRFLRSQTALRGMLILAPLYVGAWVFMLNGVYPGAVGTVTGIAYGLVFTLPFIADRLIAPKVKGFFSTLVFPTAWVALEYGLSFTPFFTWFALAYTQRDNLALIQLASVTGMWGVGFLIAWFASVVNWVWEHEFSVARIWRGASIYAGALAAVLLLGGAYLNRTSGASETVRAAGITRSFDMDVEAAKCKGDESCLRSLFDRSLDEFLESSERAVGSGARIVVWQENGLAAYQDDVAAYIDRGRDFARREDVHLVMGMYVLSEDRTADENKAVLIDPSGEASEYLKNHAVPGDDHILGDGSVLVRDSNHGRLAMFICQDTHIPRFIRQAGRADVDIALVPNHNWASITPTAARMASFRAIENGFSMIRPDYHGLSTAVDYHGNLLASMDAFSTDERIMFADLPTEGLRTIYSRVGDIFAWLCVLSFAFFLVSNLRGGGAERG